MIRYFEGRTVCKQATKPIKCYLLSFISCIFMMLGYLLVPSDAQTFQKGDEVVVQNTFLDGLEVWNIPNLDPDIVYDGTRGIILNAPFVPTGNSYKVSWEISSGTVTTGWSVAEKDGCRVIGTVEEANQRDEIVAKLFNLDLLEVDAKTNHEYNGYGCSLTWKVDGALVYEGGHSGWDAQTNRTFDPDRNDRFYSLTTGKVIRADKGTSNTSSVIAVYNETDQKAILYLHARDVFVEFNEDVVPGHPLGRQGNTGLKSSNDTDASHVHIEVRKLTDEQMTLPFEKQMEELSKPALGKKDEDRPTIDPLPYLYASVNADEQEPIAKGGDGQPPNPDINNDGQVDIIDLILVWMIISGDIQGFPQADVNDDGFINKADIIAIANELDDPEDAAAPVNFAHNQIGGITIRAGQAYIGDKIVSQETLQQLINIVREASSGSLMFKRGIAMLESILAAMTPNKTALLANYPNPFNPETWISYQLAKPADVNLTIYDLKGKLIRQLVLGHQPAGIYQSRNRSAYWDGKNALGEPVASGVYFYTLTAGDFSATRKMIIKK